MTDSDSAVPLAMLAARLHRASEADFFSRLSESGHPDLRMRHPLVLQALAPHGARPGALAAALGVSQQAMGELLDELERRGYVERTPDPTDRRARLVRLTPKGTTALDDGYSTIGVMEENYSAAVGAERYASARAVMSALIDELEAR